MTRKKPIIVNAEKHAPTLLAVARYYAQAAARYQIARQRPTARHLARTRFLEAATNFDIQLTALVFRSGPKGRTLVTASQAARIKAAAHRLADFLAEARTSPDLCPRSTHQHLARLIQATLQQREGEDRAELNQKPRAPMTASALAA